MAVQVGERWLEAEQVGGVTVVRLTTTKILDTECVRIIGQQLFDLVDIGQRFIVLDLGPVERMTSHMLGKLVGLHKKTKAAGGQLALCQINPTLFEVFKILRLTMVLSIHATEQDALQALNAKM